MNKEMRKAILEARMETHRMAREQRITAIYARIEARRAEREQKIKAIYDKIEARKMERLHRKTAERTIKKDPVQEGQNRELEDIKAAMIANVPTIHFPEDDPKYNSAQRYSYV